MLIDDVRNRIDNDQQWQDVQFIPNPQTYLNQERWKDQHIPIRQKVEPLPRNDDDLWGWAKGFGYPEPFKAETYTAYRGRLQTIHNGAQT
jgi:hypothetical protein